MALIFTLILALIFAMSETRVKITVKPRRRDIALNLYPNLCLNLGLERDVYSFVVSIDSMESKESMESSRSNPSIISENFLR